MLISPEDLDSWKSLLKASAIRNHRLLLDLAPSDEESPMSVIIGHAVVFFIIKRDLKSISQTTAAASQIPEEEPSTSRTYPNMLFLPKTTAYKKDASTCDPFTHCVDLRADASIRKTATAAGDSRTVVLASHDLVAAEAWYHGQCY